MPTAPRSRCPDCKTLHPGHGRCSSCRRQADQARGNSNDRGYGYAHQQLRAQWAPLVATGHVKCWRCSEFIEVGEAWDTGHDDNDRTTYRGPEHVACNRATSGRRGGG